MKALKSIRGLVVGFSLACTLVISMATCAVASADNAGQLSVPTRDFLRALLTANQGAMGNGSFNFNMPAIWVFSPQGRLVQIVHGHDALDAFQTEYSAIAPDAPNMMCQHVQEAVTNTSKETWSMGCADNKWVALLLHSARCKSSCDEYKSVLEQTGKKNQDTLHVKILALDSKE